MNIAYTSFSLPLKWWDNTNIAHNRIFARCVMEYSKRGHAQHVLNSRLDPYTANNISLHGAKEIPTWLESKVIGTMDVLIVFCGPFLPIANDNSMTLRTLDLIRKFEGRVVYVTCDYLLQFNPNISRYGKLFSDWPEDSLLKNKDYRYIIHGGFEHHFRTKAQQDKILSYFPRSSFIEVPLNKSGIPPNEFPTFNENPSIDLLYCGAFRADRIETFKRYFCSQFADKWVVSTTQEKKFSELPGIKALVRGPYTGMIWKFINKSMVQIIFSDSSDTKCSSTPLPTRYWEAVSSGSVAVFDESCSVWFEYNRQHLIPNPVMVSGPEGLFQAISWLKEDKTFRKGLLHEQEWLIEEFNPYREWRMQEWIT